jgi:heme-degrading monooxygenase HmoA
MTMVVEQADFRIVAGRNAEFEAALLQGLRSVLSRAKGMRGWTVEHCVEQPERYLMRIRWDSIDDHMVGYRQSPLSPQFKAMVAPFFAQPPEVIHFEALADSEGGRA